MRPKIISLGYVVPQWVYDQEQIFRELGYPQHFWRIFRDSGIDERHFWISLPQIKKSNWQEQQEEYQKGAIELSRQATLNCLDGRDPKDIGCMTFCSCTGFCPGPIVPHYLSKELGLASDTYYTNIGSMGCESGFPGLKRAYDFTIVSGKPSIAIACEICSATYFPEPDGKPDPENHFELARSNAIFADAASAALVGFDDDPRHPYIIDTETYTDTKYLNDLGYVWRDGRLRVLLSRRVPEIAAGLVGVVVPRVLERHKLTPTDIEHWVIHAAGSSVLDNIRDTLGLPEEKLTLSRETLRKFGNISSTSVGVTGKRLIQSGKAKPGDYLAMVSLGPGMTSGISLFKFEAE